MPDMIRVKLTITILLVLVGVAFVSLFQFGSWALSPHPKKSVTTYEERESVWRETRRLDSGVILSRRFISRTVVEHKFQFNPNSESGRELRSEMIALTRNVQNTSSIIFRVDSRTGKVVEMVYLDSREVELKRVDVRFRDIGLERVLPYDDLINLR